VARRSPLRQCLKSDDLGHALGTSRERIQLLAQIVAAASL
jgi:hypothetical protein